MRLKPGIRLELPERLMHQSVIQNQVYKGINRLLKDDKVWNANHPDFSIFCKWYATEGFSYQIWMLETRRPFECFLAVDKSQLIMLTMLEGVFNFTLAENDQARITAKQLLLGALPSGRYKMATESGRHICFIGYIKQDSLSKRSSVDPSVAALQLNIPDKAEILSSRRFKKLIIHFLYKVKGDRHTTVVSSAVDAWLWDLLRRVLNEADRVSRTEKAVAGQVVHLIKAYLDDLADTHQKLPGVAELADRFYMHPQHLSRVFKAEFGMSLRAYRTELKMKIGYDLLSGQKLPVHVVALELGYDDPYSFGRQFRAYFGFSPGKLAGQIDTKPDKM